jgi:hypothetical protein
MNDITLKNYNFISLLILPMTDLEKLCANIIAGKALQDDPELAEQILREAGYNVEKIKAEQKAAKYFKAAAEYEEYLNSM